MGLLQHSLSMIIAMAIFITTSNAFPNGTYHYIPGTNGTAVESSGSSNALPAVYSISQGSGATGLRKINTPWPFVVGQAIIAVFLFYIGDKSWRSHGLEPVIFGGKFILLAARCLGAIAFLISDMVHGGTFPSVGMMLIFENFLTLGYPLISEERSSGQYKDGIKKRYIRFLYAALSTVVIGLSLFIITGLVQVARKRLNLDSIVMDVIRGCPAGCFTDSSGRTLCPQPAPYLYSDMTDNDYSRFVFWVYGCLLAISNYVSVFQIFRDPGEYFTRQTREYRRLLFVKTVLTALFAIGNAGGSAVTIVRGYYDCRNATQQKDGTWAGCVYDSIVFPSDGTWLWLWVQSNQVVLEGIFAW